MFDSPFEYCPRCQEVVLLDQSLGECAREHGCERSLCPLHKLFTGQDTEAQLIAPSSRRETGSHKRSRPK
jgi:hypothetical protein